MRPIILWCCAGLLGAAAGLNYARLNHAGSDELAGQAHSIGFASASDFSTVARMMDGGKIRILRATDLAVLQKYADAPGHTADFVAAALSNIADETAAERVVPLAASLRKRSPGCLIIANLPNDWRKQGCAKAADQLVKLISSPQ
ncbi:MAG TPA: hypothetical protein VHE55_19405 [Fimbriimonadaceae bacterium]|nr:hypothetical protein [Fimbriimonadaceae bacterium]